jgi:hypothetical protein
VDSGTPIFLDTYVESYPAVFSRISLGRSTEIVCTI